mmetsp:Transcript_20531/g.36484  ORF Transcript_20531/g.36484 Transcript_20531/m.36484 type:complete len:250 (-) Transcript_20531:827-1576(-)
MYKVLDAHEIQVNERTQGSVKSATVTHKGGKGRSQYTTKTSTVSPVVVSDIIEKVAARNGIEAKGVWNPFGRPYVCNGIPDTDLVELSNDVGKRKFRKMVPSKEYRESSQQMVKLINDMKSTQKLLKEWKLFDRNESKAHRKNVGKKKDVAESGSIASRKQGNSSRLARAGLPKSSGERESTIERIAHLGIEKKTKKKVQRIKKSDYDFKNEKDPDTLIARWHESFLEVSKKKDEELVEALYLREEVSY